MNTAAGRNGSMPIERMVAVIIMAALAGMVLPRVLPISDEAKRNIAARDMANLSVGIQMYRLHNDRFPSTQEGLGALMTQPSSARNWNGPYLEKRPVDPWKRDYQYRSPGRQNPSGFDLWSLGPNEADGSDDVTNWE